MAAITDRQKSRFLGLIRNLLELALDGDRNIREVVEVLQIIKEEPKFADILLAKNSGRPVSIPTFPTWKTLTLGHPVSPKAYRATLEAYGYKIGDYANQLFDKMTVSSTETDVELVRLNVAELGFKDGARYDSICARAKELGLDLCPAEVGPKLRLEYKNQPGGEWLRIAMEPLTGSDGYLKIFDVGRDDGGLWLDSGYGRPDRFWGGGCQFVFVRRK